MTPKINQMSLREAAITYAKNGVHIIPVFGIVDGVCECGNKNCPNPGKHPRYEKQYLTHGLNSATNDTEIVKYWWDKWPNANIGMITGAINGVVVIDEDRYRGNDTSGYEIPDTLVQHSGSGDGTHYVYLSTKTLKSGSNIVPGLDSRADGGYIIASPSNHISGGKYQWSHNPFDYQLPKPPKWWVDKLLPEETFNRDVPPVVYEPGDTEIVPEGGRNDYLTREAGRRRRAGDSEIEIFYYLMGKNIARCNPPLNENEVKKIAHSISTKPTQEQIDKPFENIGKAAANRFAKSEQERIKDELQQNVNASAGEPPKNIVPEGGLIREIVDYILSQSRFPQPELATAAAVSFLGTLMGQKYKTQTGLRSNVYFIGLAQSGAGKDAARKCIKKIMHRSQLTQYLGGSKIASGSGLISALSEFPKKLYMLDEFGMMLQSMTGKGAEGYRREIMQNFMELFSTAGSVFNGTDYADRKKNPALTIDDPCVTVYGTSTHDAFYRSLSSVEAVSGAVARFLIVDAGYKRGRSHIFSEKEPDETLIKRCIDLSSFYHTKNNLADTVSGHKEAHTVIMKDDVLEQWDKLDNDVTRLMHNDAAASIYARVAENTAKLALIYAVAKYHKKPVIDAEAFIWARDIAIWSANKLMEQLNRYLADNETERGHKKIINMVMDAGKQGLTKSRITMRTQWLKARERNQFLESMVEDGIFKIKRRDSETNSASVYVHVSNL